jgi:hypothetical protein
MADRAVASPTQADHAAWKTLVVVLDEPAIHQVTKPALRKLSALHWLGLWVPSARL